MESIFQMGIEATCRGDGFRIDFEKRNLSVNGKRIIQEGKWDESVYELELDIDTEPLDYLEVLYNKYESSVPSEMSDRFTRHSYFSAKSMKELTNDDVLYGEARLTAQFVLEYTFLAMVIKGILVWDEETMGRHFYQSKQNKDFIILRRWVEKY